MTLLEYTRLADDGCPNCPEHVAEEFGDLVITDEDIVSFIRRKMAEGWRVVKMKMRWGSK